jgi:potassium-transporting ATPase KdpC subunit
MRRALLVSLRMAAVTIVLTGLVYPLVVWGLGAVLFPKQAAGSLVAGPNGSVIGSTLIAQAFTADKYFHPRPSAAGAHGYDAMASGSSNLGPTNRKLIIAVGRLVDVVAVADGAKPGSIPVDMVTSSASGLDPDISPDNAAEQIARVARARGMSIAAVRQLVAQHTRGRDLGFLGEPRVNVLELNLALDQVK